MINQANNSSPFVGGINKNTDDLPTNKESFAIRTMHDDLLSLQKGELPTNTPIEVGSPLQKNDPASAIEPQKNTAIETFFQPPTKEKNPFIENSFSTASAVNTQEDIAAFAEIPVSQKSSFNIVSYRILLGAAVFFVIVIAGLGGYYFFLKNKKIVQAPVETPVEIPLEIPEEAPVTMTPLAEKYSPDKPNYLSFDPAKETLSDLKKISLSIANDLKNKSPNLYEFSVVDSNNNPVMLPIFAAATKFNLSPVILDNLGENFSLFFYNDSGNIRLAISTTIKDSNLIKTEMLKKETTLVSDVAFLFIDPVPEIKAGKFNESSYGESFVKYFNLSSIPPLSVDYLVTDSVLIIGTSKNTTRAVFDALSTKLQTPTESLPLETTTDNF